MAGKPRVQVTIGKTQEKALGRQAPKAKAKGRGGAKGPEKPEKKGKGGATATEGAGEALAPMDPKAVKDFCGSMTYHGKNKAKPDSNCALLLEQFSVATPPSKRRILDKFKSCGGRPAKWAQDFISEESTVSEEGSSAVEDWYNRILCFL